MNKVFFILLLLSLVGCKDKFEIALRDTDKSLLVVEGTLRLGQEPTIITLSKTVNVNEKVDIKPVLKAHLTVEGKNGGIITMNEAGNGSYFNTNLGLVAGNEYRLRIKTVDNKEYLSEYVVARTTPAIDNISWKKENGDLVIYANSHDNTNNTRYYKWDYDETWEILSQYYANYKYLGGSIVVPSTSSNYQCWKYGRSTGIHIGSSAHLSADVISEHPLLLIPAGSEKISVRYSILVRQESLTKGAYEYLLLMKKNNESIGSIFDPLPSDLKGNIQCLSNPEEGVIGYLTAASLVQKRIFITQSEAGWKFNLGCPELLYIPNHPDSIAEKMPGNMPIDLIFQNMKWVYTATIPPCVDCVTRGGDLRKPSYW